MQSIKRLDTEEESNKQNIMVVDIDPNIRDNIQSKDILKPAKNMDILFICVCVTFIMGTSGRNIEDHNGTLLYKNLFENYNPKVRPVFSADKTVVVNITLDLVKILAVDEINQTFKTTVNVLIMWLDERLTWNTTDYGNIHNLVFPLDKNIWMPDLMNINAAYHPGEFGQKYAFPNVLHDGMVVIWMRVNLETQCEIHTKKFPLDVQRCDINFSTFSSTDDDLRLKNTQNSTDLGYYVETAEWSIEGNHVTTEVDMIDGVLPYRTISYHFTLKRTCTSCIVNNLLPVIVLAILDLLSFFVPSESGEKLTFPMSVFLTLAVFLTIIMVSLPESVDGVSYLCTFVAFELGLSATTLLFTVITLRLHHEMGDTKIPPYARLMVKVFRRNCIANDIGEQFSESRFSNSDILSREIMSGKTDLNENSDDVTGKMNKRTMCRKNVDIKWEYVSDAFDMMMFLIVLATQVIATTTFLIFIMI